jgi:hypothetical protein
MRCVFKRPLAVAGGIGLQHQFQMPPYVRGRKIEPDNVKCAMEALRRTRLWGQA